MSRSCRVCLQEILNPKVPVGFDVCMPCATTLGLRPLGPPRRPARPCDRCNATRFVRAMPRELSAAVRAAFVESAAPMAVTFVPELTDNLILANEAKPLSPWSGRGVLEVYTCLGCGFVEWYCRDPEAIPIGPEYMTDVIDYGSSEPYR